MKHLLILITIEILTIKVALAQKKTCGNIEYTITKNIAYLYQEQYVLTFNDSVSYSEEVNIKTNKSKSIKTVNNDNVTTKIIGKRKNKTPKFCYNTSKGFFFSEILDGDVLIVKENKFAWKWNLHNETKKIGNFRCQKATITFRGRHYTAWFTNEIPVRYGPWKFQGLSGLILEVYDDNDFFHVTTTKINIGSVCPPIEFNTKHIENYLTIKEYLKKQKEIVKRIFARMSSKLPKGSKPFVLDEDCEDCTSKKIEIFKQK